jgi:transposase
MNETAPTDAEWAEIEPNLPARRPSNFAEAPVSWRPIFAAALHVAATGCSWRNLPMPDLDGKTACQAWRRNRDGAGFDRLRRAMPHLQMDESRRELLSKALRPSPFRTEGGRDAGREVAKPDRDAGREAMKPDREAGRDVARPDREASREAARPNRDARREAATPAKAGGKGKNPLGIVWPDMPTGAKGGLAMLIGIMTVVLMFAAYINAMSAHAGYLAESYGVSKAMTTPVIVLGPIIVVALVLCVLWLFLRDRDGGDKE